MLRVAYFLLLFIVLRVVLNFKAKEIDEVLIHQYFKEKVISVKNQDKVQFIMHENLNRDKIEQYVIEPYLTSRRTKNFEVIQIAKSIDQIKIDGVKYDLK